MKTSVIRLALVLAAFCSGERAVAQTLSMTNFGEIGINTLIPDEEFLERFHIVTNYTTPGPFKIEVSFKVTPNNAAGGMWNGDYSAYLIHTLEGTASNSLTAVLINRVGRDTNLLSGYDGNGIDITLRDDGVSNVHTYEQNLGGFLITTNSDDTYRLSGTGIPDGRLVSPATVVTGDPITALLGPLGQRNPNGKWQFKIGDMQAGFEGYLDSWNVALTPYEFRWDTGTNDWSGDLNWNDDLEPVRSRDAYIDNGGTAVLTNTNGVVATLHIGETNNGTLIIKNGGVLTGDSIKIAEQPGTSGTLSFGTPGGTDSGGTLNVATIEFGSSNGTVAFNQTNNLVLTSAISGPGMIQQLGAGTTTLSAINTYTGPTIISNGVLQAGTTNAFGNCSSVSFADAAGAGMDLNNFDNKVGSIAGGGTNGGDITLGTATLTTGCDNTTATYGGEISGTGGLTKIGTGTQTFTGEHTYEGPTTITAGAIQVGNGGTTGSLGAGDIINNATLIFNRAGQVDLNQQISGAGAIIHKGPGTTTISGANTYTGPTTINAGNIVTTTTSALGNGSAVTLNGGTLSLQSPLDMGSLLWNGAATISLANPAAGHYVNVANNLSLTNGVNRFDLNGFAPTTTPTALMSAANLTTGTFSTADFGVFNVGPNYRLSISNNTLWIYLAGLVATNINNTPTIVDQTATFDYLEYQTNGKITVNPDVELTIEEPLVMPKKTTTTVNGVLNMMSGGESEGCSILSGNGVINIMGGEPLVLRGRIAPGNSIGTLTFNGNILLDSVTCRTELEVAGPNSFDRIVVNGAATLNSPSLEVTTINGGTLAYGQKVEFFTASGGITGMYAIAAMPAGYRANFLVSGTSITLVVAPESYTQVAVTPNQQSVAEALDSFITGEEVFAEDCLGPLRGVARTVVLDGGDRGEVSLALDQLTADQYPAAFEQIMPSLYATLPTLAFNQANTLNMNMFQRMWMQRVGGQGFSSRGIDPAPINDGKQFVQPDGKSVVSDGKTTVAGGKNVVGPSLDAPVEMWEDPDRPWGLFVDGNGIFSEMDTVSNLGRYDSQGGGVTAGASYRWSDSVTTGVYVGYQGLVAHYDNGSRLTDNAVRFGTFATYGAGNFYANAIVGGAYHGYDVDRSIEFSTIDRTARSNPDAWEFDAALATGYNFRLGGLVFGPVTSLQYTYVGVQGVRETGAESLDLEIDPYNSSSLLYSLGAQLAYPLPVTRRLVLTPMVFASWQHEFLQNGYTMNAAFVEGGPRVPLSYATEAPQRDFLYAGAGLGAQLDNRWEAYISYSAAAANADVLSHNVFVGFEFNF